MGYLVLTISLLASVAAFRGWLKFFTGWLRRRRRATDIANIGVGDWPGIIGAFLPYRARQLFNLAVMALTVVLLGLPHFFVVRSFFRPGEVDPSYWFHFAWTLIWWLIVLAVPAVLAASHRLSLILSDETASKDS